MKFVTAQEARSLTKPTEECEKVMQAINKRVKERAGLGHTYAVIGLTGATVLYGCLPEGDRITIKQGLAACGYMVEVGPMDKTMRISWKEVE